MLKKENDISKRGIKLRDFIKILQSLERMYKIGSIENTHVVSFIKGLRHALRPYSYMSGSEFLDLIKTQDFGKPSTSPTKRHINSFPSSIQNMSFDEIRMCLSKGTLTKNQMISIAERQFGLTRGTMLKLRKEEVKSRIESAMQNIETLKMIQKKAVE